MKKLTDIRPVAAELYFLPVRFRMPLKFGPEVTTSVTCARVRLTIENRQGRRAAGWGETPLAVQWAWPSELPYAMRNERMQEFCRRLAGLWPTIQGYGHPMEVGYDFQHDQLAGLEQEFSAGQADPMPHLAALICTSAFDVALHDAFGVLNHCDTYATYGPDLLSAIWPRSSPPRPAPPAFAADFRLNIWLPIRRGRCGPGTWWAGSTRSTTRT